MTKSDIGIDDRFAADISVKRTEIFRLSALLQHRDNWMIGICERIAFGNRFSDRVPAQFCKCIRIFAHIIGKNSSSRQLCIADTLRLIECQPDRMHGYIVLRLIVSVCKQPTQRQDSEIRYLRNIRHRCLTEIDAPHESRAVCHSADCGNVVILILIAGISVQSAVVTKQIVSILVRFIFEQYSIGVYVKNILLELDRRGVTYNGKEFVRSTVYNILKNEKYAGIYRFNGEIIENMFPQIVPTDIFEKVRAKVQKNHYGKRSIQVVYLLRNKLKCGYCGQSVNAECGTSQNGEKKYYYKCLGKKHHRCNKSVIRKDILEKLVLDKIVSELNRPQIMNAIVANLMQIQELQAKEASALNMILKEKRQTDTALNNLMAAIEQGIISNTTNKRLHELESKQEELERQILIEKSKLALQLSEDTVRKFYTDALKAEPKLLIDCLIKEIILYDDKIEIYECFAAAIASLLRKRFKFFDF